MEKPPTEEGHVRNSAALSGNPHLLPVPVTTRTGTMARKTAAAPSMSLFPMTTVFPLTAPVFPLSELTLSGPNVSVTTPALRTPVKSAFGFITATVLPISTPLLILLH